jgi:hypothetical protein
MPLRIIVSDSSCLIDLRKASLLEVFLQLPYEILIPNTLFEDELVRFTSAQKQAMISRGMQVVDLPGTGLRAEARLVGNQDDKPCPNCSSREGIALDEEELNKLMTRFFIDGGRSPYLPPVYRIDYTQVGKRHDPVRFDETLQHDYELLAVNLETLRYHAPRLRTMGYGDTFWKFDAALKTSTSPATEKMLRRSPARFWVAVSK